MLTPLPKQNRDAEAHFGVRFRHWWESVPPMKATFELKYAKGKRFPFSELDMEQRIVNRSITSKKGILLRTVPGTIGIPDYLGMVEDTSYIALMFEINKKVFFLITINDFDNLILQGKKSITFDDCCEIYRGNRI